MKQLIPAVIVIVCIVAGGAGGHFLKTASAGKAPPVAEAIDAPAPEDDAHGKDAKPEKKEKPAKADAHGKKDQGEAPASAEGTFYYKFSREFVVPMMQDGRVKSLVILNINLEADSKISQTLFEMEPKLRDNIMTTLVGLSNDGVTFDSLTDIDSYETLRSVILMNLESVVASGITNVLIVDMARQDL